jgi:cytochrome b6-f complex iron-sulfur subunit
MRASAGGGEAGTGGRTVPSGGTTRRQLLNWFLGTSFGALLAAVAYPVARFLNPPEVEHASANEVDAGAVNDPEFLDQAYKIVQFGSEPVIVVRLSETEFRAFSAVCTHLACIVGYRKDVARIWCNCHNGAFDLQGQVAGGPPPRPLAVYAVHVVAQAGRPPRVIVARS